MDTLQPQRVARLREFGEAIEVLYPLSYALKFRVKKGELRVDYGVMPLEALWWAEDMSAFSGNRREEWLWTAMIRQPEFITTEMYESELEVVRKKNQQSIFHQMLLSR